MLETADEITDEMLDIILEKMPYVAVLFCKLICTIALSILSHVFSVFLSISCSVMCKNTLPPVFCLHWAQNGWCHHKNLVLKTIKSIDFDKSIPKYFFGTFVVVPIFPREFPRRRYCVCVCKPQLFIHSPCVLLETSRLKAQGFTLFETEFIVFKKVFCLFKLCFSFIVKCCFHIVFSF